MASLMKSNRCFGGLVNKYQHVATCLGSCTMTFSVFLPPCAINEPGTRVPYLIYLSGLTCTDDNVMHKSGVQQYAAQHSIAVVCTDTSPRGLDIPGEDDSYDFGSGAGFYLNATKSPWERYRMEEYIVDELPRVLESTNLLESVLDGTRVSIFGHSMGGHGALVLSLRYPGKYKSVSAFAPICHPTIVPWGIKAFEGYLGSDDKGAWADYDATELVKKYTGHPFDVLIDTGTADEFLEEQLKPEDFEKHAAGKLNLVSTMRPGYDHSYYFIASFMKDHIEFHAKHVNK